MTSDRLPSVTQLAQGATDQPPFAEAVAASATANESRVDFNKAVRLCAKSPQLHRKLVGRFVSSRAGDGHAIRSALQRGDVEAAGMIAHQQISAAGVLGADSLSAAARDLQVALMQGTAVSLPALLDAFDQQLVAVLAILNHYLQETS